MRDTQLLHSQTSMKRGCPIYSGIYSGLPASGMTMFGENGFLIGREAFTSQAELQKTVLHELYRLNTSASATGISGTLASHETKAAFDFAERAVEYLGGN